MPRITLMCIAIWDNIHTDSAFYVHTHTCTVHTEQLIKWHSICIVLMWIYLQLSHSFHTLPRIRHISVRSMFILHRVCSSKAYLHFCLLHTHTHTKNFCFHEDRLKKFFHFNIARNPFLPFHSELGAFILRTFVLFLSIVPLFYHPSILFYHCLPRPLEWFDFRLSRKFRPATRVNL